LVGLFSGIDAGRSLFICRSRDTGHPLRRHRSHQDRRGGANGGSRPGALDFVGIRIILGARWIRRL